MTSSLGPIVSSAHLAEGSFAEISELEFGMIIAGNAFNRWMHTVRHRGRAKKLADICLVLNVEDTHTVNYAIKKLTKAGLVKEGRRGKEKTVEATEAGQAACARYREIREDLLLKPVLELGLEPEQISKLATLLRTMSGQYDQAARSATAF